MCTWGAVARDQDTGPGQCMLNDTRIVNTYVYVYACRVCIVWVFEFSEHLHWWWHRA